MDHWALDTTTDPDRYVPDDETWDDWWIPHLPDPTKKVVLSDSHRIDVLILGDGYETAEQFEAQLDPWLAAFQAIRVYSTFRGAFRIRALFRASKVPASTKRLSRYRVAIDGDGQVSDGGWWADDTESDRAFRSRLEADIEALGFNHRRYPDDLDVGSESETVIHNTIGGMYSNTVVCMLVRTSLKPNASGRTRDITLSDGRRVNVAFGADPLHEFGHAFAYLEDEYISKRGTDATRSDPAVRSLFTLSNLTFSHHLDDAVWRHISPWGRIARQAAGDEPVPLIGWLWRGGEQDEKVWHAEYMCLMNGQHKNYRFTTVVADDPTTASKGAALRKPEYCLWCQEIVAARILEKTGRLAADDDPDDVNDRGIHWYGRWRDRWRDLYWDHFGVTDDIVDREAAYAAVTVTTNDGAMHRLDESNLYQPFRWP